MTDKERDTSDLVERRLRSMIVAVKQHVVLGKNDNGCDYVNAGVFQLALDAEAALAIIHARLERAEMLLREMRGAFEGFGHVSLAEVDAFLDRAPVQPEPEATA
jgi:hypothetical protein